jgi:hypothetical protein
VHLPEKTVTSLGHKVCTKILEEGIVGYVSIQIKMRVKSSSVLKMTIKSIQPYYTAFMSAYQLFQTLTTGQEQISKQNFDQGSRQSKSRKTSHVETSDYQDRNLHFNNTEGDLAENSFQKKCLIFPKIQFTPPKYITDSVNEAKLSSKNQHQKNDKQEKQGNSEA